MDGALEQKLKRLMLLRVVMITTLLLVAVYVETVSGDAAPGQPALLPHRGHLRPDPGPRHRPALRSLSRAARSTGR